MKSKLTFHIFVTLHLAAVANSAELTNLIRNGSFELPAIPRDTVEQRVPEGWISVRETDAYLYNGTGKPHPVFTVPGPFEGNQYATFNGGVGDERTNALSQVFVATSHERHQLKWMDSVLTAPITPYITGAWYTVTIHTETGSLLAQTNINALHSFTGGWKPRTMDFDLTGGTYTVRFAATTGSPLLDNVSIFERPEDLQPEIRPYGVEVRWRGRTNQFYQVQYRDKANGAWENASGSISGNETNVFADPLADKASRFYRVLRVP